MSEKPKRMYAKRAGCAGMLAAATLFALIADAPPGGEGAAGLGGIFWLFEMFIAALIAAPFISMIVVRLGRITPPPLEGQLEGGHWRQYGARAYTWGAVGALFGTALFGLATFPIGALVGSLIAQTERAALITGVVVAAPAALYGAVWCGRRAIWRVIVGDIETSAERPPDF